MFAQLAARYCNEQLGWPEAGVCELRLSGRFRCEAAIRDGELEAGTGHEAGFWRGPQSTSARSFLSADLVVLAAGTAESFSI